MNTPTRLRLAVLLAVVAGGLLGYRIGAHAPSDAAGDAAGDAADGAAPPHGDGHAGDEHASDYVCPMHPQVRRGEAGTCPICFMDLVPAAPAAPTSVGDALTLSDEAIRRARVQTAPVERVPLHRELRLLGRVSARDDADATVTAWTAGRIERLYIAEVGARVRRGQRLARVYSPELVVAQETLIHAQHILHTAPPEAEARRRTAEATARAARAELRLLGLDDAHIDALVDDGEADESVVIRAPAGGTVLRVDAQEGVYVSPGSPILALADLDEVWVQLDVFERDLPLVSPGARVALRPSGHSGPPIDGVVAFVDPVIDPRTRSARARVVLDNPDGALRPALFVEATLEVAIHDARGRAPISVPDTAVLWTGERSLVYVLDASVSPPAAVPVEVTLGERAGARRVVTEGVFVGETVIANGAFRVDASQQIRGGVSMMDPGRVHAAPHPTPAHATHGGDHAH